MDLFGFDDDYVRRLREGDPWMEHHFIAYFTELIRRKLAGRLRPDVLQDVTQDVLYRVLEAVKAEKIREGAKLGSYVNTTCNNVYHEWIRQQSRTEPLSEKVEIVIPSEAFERLVTLQRQQRVRYALSKLAPRDAAILRVVYLEERPKAEICRKFNVTEAYLRVLVHRAKKHFRDWDGDHPPDSFFPRH